MNDQQILKEKITILGAGSMGTALAGLVCENREDVCLWALEEEISHSINKTRTNPIFLPGSTLPDCIRATSSLSEAMAGARVVLSVTPAQHLRKVWGEARPLLEDGAVVISASKGIETGSGKPMSSVLEEILGPGAGDRLAYLSGPSFAKEIAQGQPTAVVVASSNMALAERAQSLLSTGSFRAYTTDDVIGVELGGALKNVVALAVGAAEGMGLGLNSRAALITRGLAEISRLAVACGANPLTLAGLSGMGDLVLTCTGHLSRNLQVGIRLGKGESVSEILHSMNMVAEGVATARPALLLADRHSVEMPITRAVVRLLEGELSPEDALQGLMSRRLRSEREF